MLALLCSVMHASRNNVEKVTLDVGRIPSHCLQVEHANTKSNAVYKKRSNNSTSLQGKRTMSGDFELGEDEMESTSSVTFSAHRRTEQGQHLCL